MNALNHIAVVSLGEHSSVISLVDQQASGAYSPRRGTIIVGELTETILEQREKDGEQRLENMRYRLAGNAGGEYVELEAEFDPQSWHLRPDMLIAEQRERMRQVLKKLLAP